MDFEVLIMGSDANAYYMARCYHEAYGKKAHLIGAFPLAFTKYSNILTIEYNKDIWNEEGFLKVLKEYKQKHQDKKVLLISSNETYAEFISKNREELSKDFYFNYPSIDIIKSLTTKETFYETYKDSILTFPKTVYYDCKKDEEIKLDFTYPIILKPSNVVSYNHMDFEGKKKIYKIEDEEELKIVIKKIKEAKYKDTLIIQEFIEGNDSHLFDAVVYADRNKKVKLVSFAQIGLQEHASKMVGNAAVLMNGYNTFDGNVKEMVEKIKVFMESIGYMGFAEFDMKYDERDKTFKVLEINARQGRCSYYVSAAGFNLVKIMADDLIYEKDIPYHEINEEVLLSFVPKKIAKKYIKNEQFKKDALNKWKTHVNPLKYKKDTNFLRKILYFKLRKKYIKDYEHGYWKE